jgi:hypothetical protein
MSLTRSNPRLKAKKSFTLSPETVAFLEQMQKKRQAESVSAILEEILQDVRREQERASVDRAVADYYSSLSVDELEEQARWGEFALSQFPKEDGA